MRAYSHKTALQDAIKIHLRHIEKAKKEGNNKKAEIIKEKIEMCKEKIKNA